MADVWYLGLTQNQAIITRLDAAIQNKYRRALDKLAARPSDHCTPD